MPTPRETRSERAAAERPETTKNGWAEVARRRKEYEEKQALLADDEGKLREFWLKAGEVAIVQFLDEEPYIFDGHQIKDKNGKFGFEPCQLSVQKHCLMCRDGIKQSWKAAFRILDYRGSWDKDKEKFKWDEPVEKMWITNMTLLNLLSAVRSKRDKPLTELVLEITRTGSGKQNTTYMIEQAFDTDDNKMKPIPWSSEKQVKESVKPKSDEALTMLGFSKNED